MEETAAFIQQQDDPRQRRREGTLRELLQYRRAVLTVIGLTLGGTVAFYTCTTYMHKFLVNSAGFDWQTAALLNAAFIYMLIQPVVCALSDRIGHPVLIVFDVPGSLLTVPILSQLQNVQTVTQAFWLILTALSIVSFYTAINAVVKAELFPVEV